LNFYQYFRVATKRSWDRLWTVSLQVTTMAKLFTQLPLSSRTYIDTGQKGGHTLQLGK